MEGVSLSAHELARPQGIMRTFSAEDGSGGRVILKLRLHNATEEREVKEARDQEMLAKRDSEKEKTAKKGNGVPIADGKVEL